MKVRKKVFGTKFILVLILILAGFFRFYGLDWDQGHHLHPDERFLTMVATAIGLPKSWKEYFEPNISPMSPYNNGFSFFVYGTFPLYLTKIIGVLTGNNDYANIHLVGRVLSGFFDLGVVFLLFKIGEKIFDEQTGLKASFFYTIAVLPIQLAHFFAVDSFLSFFLVLSFYFLLKWSEKKSLAWAAVLGVSWGLSLACKITGVFFLPIAGLIFLVFGILEKRIKKTVLEFGVFLFFGYLFLRIGDPIVFQSGNFLNILPNENFVKNLKELNSFNNPNTFFPPAIQWISTKPIIFPLKNIVFWGLGLPLGIACWLSLVFSFFIILAKNELNRKQKIFLLVVILWVLTVFIYHGIQFAKPMRYFLPIYGFLCLNLGSSLTFLEKSLRKKNVLKIILGIWLVLALIYPLSFVSIYTKPVTRVTASRWIYKNIPGGTRVSFEEWDDPIPLLLPEYAGKNYETEKFFMYDLDTPEKWQKINEKLSKIDYYFISSNRAYGSIMKLPERYPLTIAFYKSLFEETGDFRKVAEFTSYPCFPPFLEKPWFCFNDDSADESFTVYDHPKVMIFKKISNQQI